MSDERTFTFESLQEPVSLAAYLRSLEEGFASGQLTFAQKGQEALLFSPRGLIGFSLEAKSKGRRKKLILKFAWKELANDGDEARDPLLIMTGDKDKTPA